MNFQDIYKKPTSTIKQKLQAFIFKFILVEKNERTLFDEILCICNYSLSYIIIGVIIMQSLANQLFSPLNIEPNSQLSALQYKLILVVLLVRLSLSLLYLFIQHLSLVILNKFLLIFTIFASKYDQFLNETFINVEAPLFLLEILMLSVYTSKIEYRIKHFDSRLQEIWNIAKQSSIYFLAFAIRRLNYVQYNNFSMTSYQAQVILLTVSALILILIFDFNDIIYRVRLRTIFISLDFSMIALLASWIFCVQVFSQNVPIYNFAVFFTTNFIILAFGVSKQDNYDILYRIKENEMPYKREKQIILYFEALRQLGQSNIRSQRTKQLMLIEFIQFHRRSCLKINCPFTKRYNILMPVRSKIELIEQYTIKTLESLSRSKPSLHKYLIYRLSPKDKVFKFLNGNSYYVKRQLMRINSVKRISSNQIKILEAQKVKDQVTELIEQYLISGRQFYKSLLNQSVNCQMFNHRGIQMVEIIQKIEKMKENSANYTQQVRILMNNFTTRMIQGNSEILQTVIDPPFLIHKTTETGPTFLISAENENFLRILDVNVEVTKQFYFEREHFLELIQIDLLPEQIKVLHLIHFNEVAKKLQFDGQKDFPIALFMPNKIGYMVFFSAIVYLLNTMKGRMWCAAFQIMHRMNSILLFENLGNSAKVMGISQLCIYQGFKLQDKNQQLTDQMFAKLRQTQQNSKNFKTVLIQPYEKLFKESDFVFYSGCQLQIIQETTAFGLTFFLVLVKSNDNSNLDRSSKTPSRSRMTLIEKKKQHQISITGFVPKKQFFYHSDGIIRHYSQSNEIFHLTFPQNTKNQIYKQIDTNQQENLFSDGITQMRLLRNGLDFIQNIEEETEFFSKQISKQQSKTQRQLYNFNITKQFFQQSVNVQINESPKWVMCTRIFFIVVLLCLVALCVSTFVYNQSNINTISKQKITLNTLSNNEVKYIQLSKAVISFKYYPNATNSTFRQIFQNVTMAIKKNIVILYEIEPSVESYLTLNYVAGPIQKYIIQFTNLYTNLSNQNSNQQVFNEFNQTGIINLLIDQIVPNFDHLMSTKVQQYKQINSNFVNYNLIILSIIFTLAVLTFIWVIVIIKYLKNFQLKIIKIFAKINDKALDKQLLKIRLFQQYFYFDKDIYCEEDLQYVIFIRNQKLQEKQGFLNSSKSKQRQIQDKRRQKTNNMKQIIQKKSLKNQASSKNLNDKGKMIQNDQQSDVKLVNTIRISQIQEKTGQKKDRQQNPYIKKLIHQNEMRDILLLSFTWTFIVGVLTFAFYKLIADFIQLNESLTTILKNIDSLSYSFDMIWIMFNTKPDNPLNDYYQEIMYQAENNFKSQSMKLFQSNQFSTNYLNFFNNIWNGDACQYLDSSFVNCRNQLSGALLQGINQLLAYYNRKYDFFMNIQGFSAQQFRSYPVVHNIAALRQKNYMVQLINKNSDALLDQLNSINLQFQKNIFIIFILLLVFLLTLVGVYKYLANQNQKLSKMVNLFKLIEFDNLKDIKQFKVYFKANYYDKIYK